MPELEQALRNVLPASDSAAIMKRELATLRANFAEVLYNMSEPIEAELEIRDIDTGITHKVELLRGEIANP